MQSSEPPQVIAEVLSRSRAFCGKLNLASTYDSDAHLTDDNARVASQVGEKIGTDSRFKLTQVQVRASNGVVRLQGNVGNEAERVAAGDDAAQVPQLQSGRPDSWCPREFTLQVQWCAPNRQKYEDQ